MIYEIVILAMIAAFLGLRLYSVLGRRAEHEEEPIPTRFDAPEDKAAVSAPATQGLQPSAVRVGRAAAVVKRARPPAAAGRRARGRTLESPLPNDC